MLQTSFELSTASRVVFGQGCSSQVRDAISALGMQKVLLVTGKSTERGDQLERSLKGPVVRLQIPCEPTLDMAEQGRTLAQQEGCDGVIALGGGSAIDAGKAIAALVSVDGPFIDHLEVIGKGLPLPKPGLPFIAIPTTCGTGAEVTRNSSLISPKTQQKASLRSPHMLPKLALVDPDLLEGMPHPVLAASAMDALSHLMESFVSLRANPLTMALARDGMGRIVRSLRPAYEQGLDARSREDLALASLFGGLCLANSGLGAVHGFAAPLGGQWGIGHGVACAVLLPAVMRTNRRALGLRLPTSPILDRYRELDALCPGEVDVAAWTTRCAKDLSIPSLSRLGVHASQIPQLVAKAKIASSMRGNPIALTDEELMEVVGQSL